MTDQQGNHAAPAGAHPGASTGIDDEALDWVIRMGESDADWDAFMTWMEGDPNRAKRYDHAAATLQDIEAVVATLPATPVVQPHRPGPFVRRMLGSPMRRIVGIVGTATAASVALLIWTQAPGPYVLETVAGQQRVVALADGSSIVLAGGSKVRLDHASSRIAVVEQGEVLFHVRHVAKQPFRVRVGALELVDLGTVFDIKISDGRTRVAVSEGAVMVDPDGAALQLSPGQAVVAAGSALERREIARADVGSWREGRLAFDDAPLSEVASDISRQLGTRVAASPTVAQRRFRGTIDVRSIRGRPALLGSLLDVGIRQDASGWTLVAHR